MPVPMVPDSRNTLERLELLPRDGESGRVAVHGRRIAVGLFVGVFALAAAAVGVVTHGVDLSTLGDTPEPHEALPAPRERPEPADHVGDADEYRADAAELGGSPQSTMALTVIPQNFIHESRAFVDQRELEALRKEALERGDADATSTLGLRKRAAPKRDLKASVITIALGGAKHLDDDDRDKTMDLIGRMARTYGEDAVRDNARLAPGVVAMDWPKSEENSEYALSSIRELKHGDRAAMETIPWLTHFTHRDENGRMIIDEHWPPRFEHHVGCLFAHLFAWQLAKDMGNRHTVIFESDGGADGLLAVPFESVQFAVDNAPEDFEVLFLNKLEDPRLDHRFPWTSDLVRTSVDDASGATIDFFRYRNPFAAGISGYVVTDAFIDKIHKRIAENGADMIDAWMYKLCGDSTNERDPADPEATFLRCYAAVDRRHVDRYGEEHPDGP